MKDSLGALITELVVAGMRFGLQYSTSLFGMDAIGANVTPGAVVTKSETIDWHPREAVAPVALEGLSNMIVQACLNGSRAIDFHQRLPLTSEDIANDGASCIAAGPVSTLTGRCGLRRWTSQLVKGFGRRPLA